MELMVVEDAEDVKGALLLVLFLVRVVLLAAHSDQGDAGLDAEDVDEKDHHDGDVDREVEHIQMDHISLLLFFR